MQKKKISPQTPIVGLSNRTIGDFWAWAYSDILSNRNRAIFAEFLVASALNLTHTPRIEWDMVDLRYRGKTIEVKSAGYLQSWKQSSLSKISFDIAKKIGWDAKTNISANVPTRAADCYIFCVLTEKDRNKIDVLNLAQWKFFVMSTDFINATFGEQKSVSLSKIENLCTPVMFKQLQSAINTALSLTTPH